MLIFAVNGEQVNRAVVPEVDAQHPNDVFARAGGLKEIGHFQVTVALAHHQERRAGAVLKEDIARAVHVEQRHAVHHLAMRQHLRVIQDHFPSCALPFGDDVARTGYLKHREEPIAARPQDVTDGGDRLVRNAGLIGAGE